VPASQGSRARKLKQIQTDLAKRIFSALAMVAETTGAV